VSARTLGNQMLRDALEQTRQENRRDTFGAGRREGWNHILNFPQGVEEA